jgi:molybdopterin-guanine dinucleotide biosynthesis protein A
MSQTKPKISCIILAGGEGKRVGGVDKGLLEYKNRALIEHVINTVSPQIDDLIISANRNIKKYEQYTDKVISDESEQYLGPLAGINAALPHCDHNRVLITPCDTPFLPDDIIARFLSDDCEADLYIAESDNKLQPVMLMHKKLHESISRSLKQGQLRLMQWARSQQPEIIPFQETTAFKSFNNKMDFET